MNKNTEKIHWQHLMTEVWCEVCLFTKKPWKTHIVPLMILISLCHSLCLYVCIWDVCFEKKKKNLLLVLLLEVTFIPAAVSMWTLSPTHLIFIKHICILHTHTHTERGRADTYTQSRHIHPKHTESPQRMWCSIGGQVQEWKNSRESGRGVGGVWEDHMHFIRDWWKHMIAHLITQHCHKEKEADRYCFSSCFSSLFYSVTYTFMQ